MAWPFIPDRTIRSPVPATVPARPVQTFPVKRGPTDPITPATAPVSPAATPAASSGIFGGLMQRASDFRTQNPGALSLFASGISSRNPNNQALLNQANYLQQQGGTNQTVDYLMKNGLVENEADARAVAGNDKLLSAILKRNGLDGGVSYGKTPVWGTRADGTTGLMVIGDDGTAHELDTATLRRRGQ